MYETDDWCSVGKQASRKSLKPDNARVRIQDTDDETLVMPDRHGNAVQADTLRTRESPLLEDGRELSSSGASAADAFKTATTVPLKCSDGPTRDEISLETEGAMLPEKIISTNQTSLTLGSSHQSGTATLPDIVAIDIEATPGDNNNVSKQVTSLDSDNITTCSNKISATMLTSYTPSSHEETDDAKGAIVTDGENGQTPSTTHHSSIPEALTIDTASVPLLQSKESARALPEKQLAFDQPILDPSLYPGANTKTPTRTSPRKKSKLVSPHTVTIPGPMRTPKLLNSTKSLRADYPDETPQIGTSLLRRESLRRKESPTKKKDGRKSKTPKKRDTLQRRDTLQEREILQKIIAETNANHSDGNLGVQFIETGTLQSRSSTLGTEESIENHGHGSPEAILHEETPDGEATVCAAADLPVIDEIAIEKDLHRTMEAIDVYEGTGAAELSQPTLDDAAPNVDQATDTMDRANEVLAKTELENVSQVIEATKKQATNEKTRSGTRFSDDTSMLKDFLNRAQARKAAQKPTLSAPDALMTRHSPRRSPRKTHGPHAGQASSPQKLQNIADRPGTPPGTPKTEALDSDEDEEVTAEPASCRRSTRTRLPAPSKAPPGAPSFIPVRRADGTDPVVLQKSQAQELAVSTRANTRRNKGASKPPLLALQNLPTEDADVVSTTKQRAERAKSVAWAERLASYQDARADADDGEERRPKVRRLRGLGAVNGTPAAKRTTAVVATSNGTPAPKRRGKI